jgi:hypothetical protein
LLSLSVVLTLDLITAHQYPFTHSRTVPQPIVNASIFRKKMSRYIYYVILPLALGALPYLFLRKDASVFVIALQELSRNYFEFDFSHRHVLRLDSNWDWLIYNLPDALWAFSFTNFIVLATRTDDHKIKLLYLFASGLIMLVLEITVGTFDWFDLAAIALGCCISILILKTELRNQNNESSTEASALDYNHRELR